MLRKRFWIPVLVVVVAAAAVVFRASRGRATAPSWRTEEVKRGAVRAQVSATGNLKAVTTVQVGSQVSGTIAALNADFNDQVRKGQVLAQLDPTFLKAQAAQNRADLERTRVQVRQAVRDSARVFALGSQGLASQSEQDATQTALDAARASEQSARAGLDRAETNLRYATILSPIDGVVISRSVDVGQTVAASLSAPTLFTIANDLTRMQLEAAVDEADIGSIQEGQTATFTVDSHPDLNFNGTVYQVRLQPETVQNVVTYTVVILVENPELKLLPGMTANVTILTQQAEGVLRVPNAALRFRPAGAAGEMAGGGAGAGGRGGMAPGGMGQGGMGQGGQGRMGGQGRPEGMGRGGNGGGGMPGGAPGSGMRSEAGAPGGGPGGMEDGGGERRRGAPGLVYVLRQGEPKPVRIRTGITDGSFTAAFSDSLREGELLVVGTDRSGAGGGAAPGTVNPFAPRFPGMGRR
jgi:HlyD family secretion protein